MVGYCLAIKAKVKYTYIYININIPNTLGREPGAKPGNI
jgi:hypothetical protein